MRPLTLEFIIITMLWLAEPISEQQHHFVYYTCFDSTNRFWNQRTPGSVSLFVKAPTFPGTLPTEPRELTSPQSPAFSIPKEDTPGFCATQLTSTAPAFERITPLICQRSSCVPWQKKNCFSRWPNRSFPDSRKICVWRVTSKSPRHQVPDPSLPLLAHKNIPVTVVL